MIRGIMGPLSQKPFLLPVQIYPRHFNLGSSSTCLLLQCSSQAWILGACASTAHTFAATPLPRQRCLATIQKSRCASLYVANCLFTIIPVTPTECLPSSRISTEVDHWPLLSFSYIQTHLDGFKLCNLTWSIKLHNLPYRTPYKSFSFLIYP